MNPNSKQQSITDIFGPVMSSYTRKQAIEDGQLHPVSELFPQETRVFKFPVCFTDTVASLIEGPDMKIWVYDICTMAALHPTRELSPSRRLFKILLPISKGKRKLKTFELLSVVGPGDNAEPVITICFPNED